MKINFKAKVILFILSILIILVGSLPFLKGITFLSPYLAFIPTEDWQYNIIIIVLGLIGIIAVINKRTY